jgi:hypothetical protein
MNSWMTRLTHFACTILSLPATSHHPMILTFPQWRRVWWPNLDLDHPLYCHKNNPLAHRLFITILKKQKSSTQSHSRYEFKRHCAVFSWIMKWCLTHPSSMMIRKKIDVSPVNKNSFTLPIFHVTSCASHQNSEHRRRQELPILSKLPAMVFKCYIATCKLQRNGTASQWSI